MRNLLGLEMLCFGIDEHVMLTYEGGTYRDPKGEAVKDVVDLTCYACSTSYYTRQSSMIAFCPNCGEFERHRFASRQLLREALQGQDWSWLKHRGLTPVAALALDGQWRLRFASSPEALTRAGGYMEARSL